MPSPTFLEFAKIADASYYYQGRPTPNFTRLHYGQLTSGFKGSFYERANGASPEIVVAFAGTDNSETESVDGGDELADAGFAGPRAGAAAAFLSPVVGAIVLRGTRQLQEQVRGAQELTQQAMHAAGSGGSVYVVGHSLGGGLAQIICSMIGLKGVAFNAPATSQLGISRIPADRFVSMNEDSDPVSGATSHLGDHQGKTMVINAGVSGMASHSLNSIIRYLESSGGSRLGRKRPF